MRPFALFLVIFLSLACSTTDNLFSSSAAKATPTTGAGLSQATSAAANPPVASSDNWPTYVNGFYGFHLKYPPDGQILEENDIYAHIQLTFAQGTTLTDKYLEVNVNPYAESCESQEYGADPSTTEQLQIHGLDWLKEFGSSGGAGSSHEWIAYSTFQAGVCVNLNFFIISSNMYDPPPPDFDRDAETAVFAEIVSTFEWLGS
jgi:hypothetical protein